jgi:excisionase family DNA binding protein
MSEAVQPAWKPERPLLLTQQQAALWLNVSERTIRNLIRARKLPVRFIGKAKSKNPRCLIPAVAVEKFARQVAGQ